MSIWGTRIKNGSKALGNAACQGCGIGFMTLCLPVCLAIVAVGECASLPLKHVVEPCMLKWKEEKVRRKAARKVRKAAKEARQDTEQ